MNTTTTLIGTPNFRDLGGLRNQHGQAVQAGKLFRTEGPAYLTCEDIEKLHALNLRLICDLRSDGERQSAPNSWCDGAKHLKILNFNATTDLRAKGNDAWEALRADQSATGARRAVIHNYRSMPWAMAESLRQMFNEMIEQQQVPTLIHCTAGKDRTGFVVAIILLALDFELDTIFDDYMLTERFIDDRFSGSVIEAFVTTFGFEPNQHTLDAMIGLEPAYLQAALDSAVEESGSIDNYLHENLHLTAQRLAQLKQLLLTD